MVTMAAEVAFPSKNKALLFAVKNLQNTSAYQDQWIADIDLAAAIRHEYGLWDPQFDAAVSYKTVTKAINSDPQLKLALDPNAFKTNKTKMFRRRYKPKTAATIKVTDVEALHTAQPYRRRSLAIHGVSNRRGSRPRDGWAVLDAFLRAQQVDE